MNEFLAFAFSTCVFAVAVMVLYGYGKIVAFRQGVSWHFALALICLILESALRSFYWDMLPFLIQDKSWDFWCQYSGGGLIVDAIFNALMAYGAYQALCALVFLIPEEDRDAWNWWNAAFYPPKQVFQKLLQRIGVKK